jgi:glycosyltransferase involved in cell wall biosynthesis
MAVCCQSDSLRWIDFFGDFRNAEHESAGFHRGVVLSFISPQPALEFGFSRVRALWKERSCAGVACRTMLPVTIWMNMPSFHQDDLFRELSARVDLQVIYDHPMTNDRKELGWTEVKSEYNSCILEQNRKLRHAVSMARSERDRVHIINGIWAERTFAAVAFVLGNAGTSFAVYSEAPDILVSRSLPKRIARSVVGRWVAHRAGGLFAVSHLASDYYGGLGFSRDKIYPFGYFHSSPIELEAQLTTDRVDIVFVGRLIHRKGVDILMEAINPLLNEFPQLQLSFIGTGVEHAAIEARVRRDGLLGRVVLEGVCPSSRVHNRLARASALVLPSRWDGWGMVINEAFSAGIPVIASDRCGGADLILHGVNGYRFRSEDVDDLRGCLTAFLCAEQTKMRMAARKTGSALTMPLVSDYLVACLEHMCGKRFSRPVPPWLEPPGALPELVVTTR